MIRKIVVTSLLVVCALSAAAQRPRARIEWGVLGGINIPDYTTNMSGTDVKNKLGWQAGITTAVNLGAFAVEPPGVMFCIRVTKFIARNQCFHFLQSMI